MPVRAIFFDFGGTLVAPLREAFPVFAEVLGAQGQALDRVAFDRAEARLGRSTEAMRFLYLGQGPGFWEAYDAELLATLGIDDPGSEIARALHEAMTSPRWHPPYAESAEVLQALQRRGLDLHLVSNNSEYLPELVDRLGWTDRFRSITFSQEVGVEKPDPRIFHRALARARCSPSDVLHVGDSWEADVVGAGSVGIPALWVDRSAGPAAHPGPRVRDLRGVLSYLDRAAEGREGAPGAH